MSARREELTRDRRPPLRRAGLPGHVAGRPRRGARRAEAVALPPHRLEGRPALGGRLGRRRGLPRGARRRAGRAPAPERIRLALRAHLAVVAGQLDIATVFVREWRYLEGERRDALRRRAPPLRGADPRPLPRRRRAAASCAPTSTSRPRRCSSSRLPTGPTRGSGPAPTPTSSPTASTRRCSTACAATPTRLSWHARRREARGTDRQPVLDARDRRADPRGRARRCASASRSRRVHAAARATRPSSPRRSPDDVDAIVVFSGDGTYNEALNGADGAVPFGFLPGGGTSVLPRALGLPRDPVAAARAIGAALAEGATAAHLARRGQRPALLLLGRPRLRRRGGAPARRARPRRRPARAPATSRSCARSRRCCSSAAAAGSRSSRSRATAAPRSSSSRTATRTPTRARSPLHVAPGARVRGGHRLRRADARAAARRAAAARLHRARQGPARGRRRRLRPRPRPDRRPLRPSAAVAGRRRGSRRRRPRRCSRRERDAVSVLV